MKLFLVLLLSFSVWLGAADQIPRAHQLSLDVTSKQHLLRQTHQYTSSSNSGGSIFGGFVIGPILFFISFVMLWFNQKRAVIDHRRLKLAQEICVDVNPFRRDQIVAANMKLTHITGNSTTQQTIGDQLSGISAQGAIKIDRSVQVMQWRATVNNNNNRRDVTYHLGWQSSNQSNVEGRYNDPANWFIKSQKFYNDKVFIGQYLLSKTQADQCSKANQIMPNIQNAYNICNATNRRVNPQISGQYIYFPSPVSQSISDHGALRVKYSYCPIGPISLMAKTVNNNFQPFPIAQFEGGGKIQKNQLPACCCISNCMAQLLKPIQTIDLVEEQLMSKNQMIDKAVQKSKLYTLIIRIASFVLMVLGMWLFFSPISNILGYIPFVGGFLKSTVGFILFVAALIICIPLYLIAFSLAWLWYHPKVGIAILLVAIAILVIILVLNGRASSNDANAAATTAKHMWQNLRTFE